MSCLWLPGIYSDEIHTVWLLKVMEPDISSPHSLMGKANWMLLISAFNLRLVKLSYRGSFEFSRGGPSSSSLRQNLKPAQQRKTWPGFLSLRVSGHLLQVIVHPSRWIQSICDTVAYNKTYVFGLHPYSWHRDPKTLEISEVRRGIKVKGVSYSFFFKFVWLHQVLAAAHRI